VYGNNCIYSSPKPCPRPRSTKHTQMKTISNKNHDNKILYVHDEWRPLRWKIKVIEKSALGAHSIKNSFRLYICWQRAIDFFTRAQHALATVDTMAAMECNFATNNEQMNMICKSADIVVIGIVYIVCSDGATVCSSCILCNYFDWKQSTSTTIFCSCIF